MGRLDGRVALITGAAGGQGTAEAERNRATLSDAGHGLLPGC